MSAPVDLQRVLALAVHRLCEHRRLTARERQVCAHIRDCRTPALGGRRQRCTRCRYERVRYHSCRDRHCPKCQGAASARWAERQRALTLPVAYHHAVFTLPAVLNTWVGAHPRALYDQLFASAWASLRAFTARHPRLGGQGAMSAVLHTWGQTLTRHVHLHCLVPAGALTEDGRWRSLTGAYLFPVRALSRRFRGHFVSAVRRRVRAGELPRIAPDEVDAMLERLMNLEWVVYTKPCLDHTERVVDYLARYTHRIALTDARLVAINGQRVALRYRDYRDDRHKTLWLDAETLMQRFLLHVLPAGFMRVRHFGFLANRCRAKRLRHIRTQLPSSPHRADARITADDPQGAAVETCPRCRTATMHTRETIAPKRSDGG